MPGGAAAEGLNPHEISDATFCILCTLFIAVSPLPTLFI